MADLRDGSGVFQTVDNTGTGIAELGDNYLKHVISQSGVGRELIVSVAKTDITDEELNDVIAYFTTSQGTDGGGDSAFTVGGVGTADGSAFESGTTDTVFLRLQGTGEFTAGDAADGASGDVTGVTVTTIAVFQPVK